MRGHGLPISQAAVNKWFLGQTTPGLEHLLFLSKFFRVRLDWLITGRLPMREGDTHTSTEIAQVVDLMHGMSDHQQRQLRRIAETAFDAPADNIKSA
jgi:hypothetical protein